MINERYFCQFSIKTDVVGAHQNCLEGGDSDEHPQHRFLWRPVLWVHIRIFLKEAILMSTHNKGFYGEISKSIPLLSSNTQYTYST